jgi:hypothetical protein
VFHIFLLFDNSHLMAITIGAHNIGIKGIIRDRPKMASGLWFQTLTRPQIGVKEESTRRARQAGAYSEKKQQG